VSLLFPAAYEAEQYRSLRHVIEHQRAATGLTVIAITSPAIGDGKTTTAINLAGALAQAQGVRVLLVDADLRRPSVAEHLGLRRQLDQRELPGLVDALVDESFGLDAVTQSYQEYNLDVVTAGGVPEAPYEVLRSPRFSELLAEARRHYHYVVLDTPPLVAVPDSRVITKAVDGVLLVIGAHRTPRKFLEEALGLVEPAKLLGLVYNQDERPLSSHYRGYYGAPSLATNGHGTSRWDRLVRRGRRGGTRGERAT
jgi:capsular exopolysaccharide synthesis family protein